MADDLGVGFLKGVAGAALDPGRVHPMRLQEERVGASGHLLAREGRFPCFSAYWADVHATLREALPAGVVRYEKELAGYTQPARPADGPVTLLFKDGKEQGERDRGVRGFSLHPLGPLRRTSIPYIWCILSGFPTLLTPLAEGASFSQARSSRATCSSAPTGRPPACARARCPRRRAGRAGCGSRGTSPGAGCSQPRAVLSLRADIHLNLLNNSCNRMYI